MIPPSTGMKINAITSEADSVTSTVSGRYFMNSPTTPGQARSGRNTASVVTVDEITGQAMRRAA